MRTTRDKFLIGIWSFNIVIYIFNTIIYYRLGSIVLAVIWFVAALLCAYVLKLRLDDKV